jgi:hypothetical protein
VLQQIHTKGYSLSTNGFHPTSVVRHTKEPHHCSDTDASSVVLVDHNEK